jgi:hypothetical protein
LRRLAVAEGTVETEQRLHAQFAEARLNGEWFTPVPALRDFIAGLVADATALAEQEA